jgi:hypothetical protein
MFNNKVSLESRESIRKVQMLIMGFLLLILIDVTSYFLFGLSSEIAWNMPLILEYHQVRLIWGINLSMMVFIFASAATLAILTRHQKRGRLLFSVILIVIGIEVLFWRWTRPIAPSLEARVSPDGVILQTSGSSCVAAACANIASLYGVKTTEKEMDKILGTTLLGTRAAQIIYGMN